jgi:hypothetical protein
MLHDELVKSLSHLVLSMSYTLECFFIYFLYFVVHTIL